MWDSFNPEKDKLSDLIDLFESSVSAFYFSSEKL